MSNKANIKFTQSTTILKIPVDILNAGLTSAVQKKKHQCQISFIVIKENIFLCGEALII